jgi:hypothetical protein
VYKASLGRHFENAMSSVITAVKKHLHIRRPLSLSLVAGGRKATQPWILFRPQEFQVSVTRVELKIC